MPIVRVSFLGPEGSFSHIVSKILYPDMTPIPVPSIMDAVYTVEEGAADIAVIPIENSINGPVQESLKTLSRTLLKTQLMAIYRVRLVIAGSRGARVLYGHSHAIAEASKWIRRNLKGVKIIPVSSTSEAANRAASTGGLCICSREAAISNGLEVLDEDVGDGVNYTKFLSLSWRDSPEGGERTMIITVLKDKPGSLYRFLEPFAVKGINLTMIYSMPLGSGEWRYLFYIEMEGDRRDSGVREAIEEARSRALYLNLLGSYPVMNIG